MALPKPLSDKPSGMPQPRRKSGLRTASGSLQEQVLARLRALRDDPTLVLPLCPDGEPRAIARLRRSLQAMGRGRIPLAARFDRHLLGAVAKSLPMADLQEMPRLLDAKVAGARRFYLPRGHLDPACVLGVQNHDEPRVLLVAYARQAAKGLHFFAGSDLWCSGPKAVPPAQWVEDLSEATGLALVPDSDGWSCPHPDGACVRLRFEGGPRLQCCGPCGHAAGGLHVQLRERYLGPNNRQPVGVEVVLPDGSTHGPGREELARYRAGLLDEAGLCAEALAHWRSTGAGGKWVLGDRVLATLDAFLDALSPEPWERPALAALCRDGFSGPTATVAAVLDERRGRIADAVRAVLGSDGAAFVQGHPGLGPRDLLRAAHDEARRRSVTAQLPLLEGLGPQGRWLDDLARALLADGRPAALAQLRRSLASSPVPRTSFYAVLHAVGGALDLESKFTAEEKEAAAPLLAPAHTLLHRTGSDYAAALAEFLRITGSGEEPAA